ncbi:MAG: chromosome segregation protein SMC, partial [Candidatus Limnocylindrus sp.]|jgi:chromosome segregation protein
MSRLRLREVRLSGFKTFADKTTIAFTPGITAIVGPNGSGKSNVVDALRWALGEAGRGIRSKRVDEVIFAGSEKRRPLGLAEVSLSIANDDGLFDLPFTEIEIARRADRGGGQEYLLNREKIRLRDLNELLDGAGLAENGLLFIGQGAVDQALSLKAEERRALVEEFAGTARHERRRARAEAEMKEAIDNRARVEEILGTLRPQERRLATLAKQEAGREELLADAVERIAALGAARGAWIASRRMRLGGQLASVTGELHGIREQLRSADEEAHRRRERLGIARTELDAARRALDAAREAREAAERSQARVDAEFSALARDAERIASEVVVAEAEIASVEALRAAAAPSVDAEAVAALEILDADLSSARRELEALTDGTGAGSSDSALRAQRSREVERADLAARLDRLQAEFTAVTADGQNEDPSAAENVLILAATAASDTAARLAAAAAELTEAEAAVAAARATVGESERAARRAEAEAAAVSGRLAALETRRTALQDRALAKAAHAMGGRGLLAGVELREEGRAAVLAALGALARGFVVDQRGASLLDDEQGALLIEGSDPIGVSTHPTLPSLNGEILSDPHGLLGRLLANVVVAPSVAAALGALSDLPPGGTIVTRAGAVVRHGGVVIRETEPDDALLDSEIRRAAAESERLRASAASLRSEAIGASGALSAAEARLSQARHTEISMRAALRAAESARAEAERRRDAIRRSTSERAERISRLESAIGSAQGRLNEITISPEHAVATDAATQWRTRVEELTARRADLAVAVEADRAALRTWELARARGDATVAGASARIARAAEERGALETRVANLRAQLTEQSGLAAAARAAAAQREEGVQVKAALQVEIESEIAKDEEVKRGLRHREQQLDEALRPLERDAQAVEFERERFIEELSGDLAAFGRRLSEDPRLAAGIPVALRSAASADAAETLADGDAAVREELARKQAAALVIYWESQSAASEPMGTIAPDPEEVRALERLRRKIGPLEAGGASVVIEHQELRARLESLEVQTRDLDGAIEKAATLMRELDQLVETTFTEQFAALQTTFAANFQLLFGGGDAQLRLADDSDARRPGVEIDARPPLKRRQQLSLLSGGERALTGVALLLGMLAVRPLPFVVLDEVDAALDEANVTRFGDAIRELSERTQVVVITHNRGTVEVADSLWGVTVGEDAASRVFGLRLDEAKRIADQARAEREAAR